MRSFVVRQLSFEIQPVLPNPSGTPYDVQVDHSPIFDPTRPQSFLIAFKVRLVEPKQRAFTFSLDAFALFETQDSITPEYLESPIVLFNAPAIAFPFVRSFVNTVSVNAGMPGLILPSINFHKSTTRPDAPEDGDKTSTPN